MKKFAFYLPQFHEIPENNKWWGKGFTEWTNVKKAKSYFNGHIQPIHPLDSNYYTLDNVNVLKWQAELAKKYNIDGMIFYHYYFCGKKLLEKPAEMLLNNKKVYMPFFFCWANHSWYRSWEGSKELLVEQIYGTEKEWEEHFRYLLTFFNDYRYIKKDNKPILVIYNPEFSERKAMLEYFNRRCKENGYNGIYIIETIASIDQYNRMTKEMTQYDRMFHFREPTFSLSLDKTENTLIHRGIRKLYCLLRFGMTVIEGNELLKLRMKYKMEDKIVPGLFFSWDNSPRHGKRAFIINSISKKIFMNYMDCIKESDYVFINAWNEWCEGMIFEPTEENGYRYLEWIKEWSENNE